MLIVDLVTDLLRFPADWKVVEKHGSSFILEHVKKFQVFLFDDYSEKSVLITDCRCSPHVAYEPGWWRRATIRGLALRVKEELRLMKLRADVLGDNDKGAQ